MYRVKCFNMLGKDHGYDVYKKTIEQQVNDFLISNPNVIPISISSNADGSCEEVYILYKIKD